MSPQTRGPLVEWKDGTPFSRVFHPSNPQPQPQPQSQPQSQPKRTQYHELPPSTYMAMPYPTSSPYTHIPARPSGGASPPTVRSPSPRPASHAARCKTDSAASDPTQPFRVPTRARSHGNCPPPPLRPHEQLQPPRPSPPFPPLFHFLLPQILPSQRAPTSDWLLHTTYLTTYPPNVTATIQSPRGNVTQRRLPPD